MFHINGSCRCKRDNVSAYCHVPARSHEREAGVCRKNLRQIICIPFSLTNIYDYEVRP